MPRPTSMKTRILALVEEMSSGAQTALHNFLVAAVEAADESELAESVAPTRRNARKAEADVEKPTRRNARKAAEVDDEEDAGVGDDLELNDNTVDAMYAFLDEIEENGVDVSIVTAKGLRNLTTLAADLGANVSLLMEECNDTAEKVETLTDFVASMMHLRNALVQLGKARLGELADEIGVPRKRALDEMAHNIIVEFNSRINDEGEDDEEAEEEKPARRAPRKAEVEEEKPARRASRKTEVEDDEDEDLADIVPRGGGRRRSNRV